MFMMFVKRFVFLHQSSIGDNVADISIIPWCQLGYGESVPVRKLAEKFGQGHLPVKEFTPGEAEDNVADISIMASIGWMPSISVLDSVDVLNL